MANKRLILVLLICTFILSFSPTTFAIEPATTSSSTTLDRANALNELGLFAGTDKGFDLESKPNRTQAIIFLLRMLGEEKTAQNSSYLNPFTDVPAWADKYVSYAYAKGYTSGISKTEFGTNNIATPEQFITFMLRAIGYSDKAGEFTLPTAIQKAETLEIIPAGKYQVGSETFVRGDCINIIYDFLSANKKDQDITVAESLIASGAIDIAIATKYGFGESTRISTQNLFDLGLFNKSDFSGSNIFSLKRAPTKVELAFMYVKILGREEAAIAVEDENGKHPYTDVPEWAKKYVAFTYWNNLLVGNTNTTFGSLEKITIEQFLTCILRALEYDSNGFNQAKSISKAEEIGLIPVGKYSSTSKFECGDCADIIYNALKLNKKLEGITLIESLIYDGVVSDIKAAEYSLISSSYQRIKVPIKLENTDNILYAKDVIHSIPNAKFMSFGGYGSNAKMPFSYYRAFDKREYDELLKTASNTSLYKYYSEGYHNINNYVGDGSTYGFTIATVYDASFNIIATAIFDAKSAIASGQVEFVLINIDTKRYLHYLTTLTNRIINNVEELPNDTFYFERYKEEVTIIDKITNKQKGDTFLNNNGDYIYKLVINKDKYPGLASTITGYNDIFFNGQYITADFIKDDVINAISDRFNNGRYRITNSIDDVMPIWMGLDYEWDRKHAFIFGDEKGVLVGWVNYLPSQVKIVDIGIVEMTFYE